MNTLKLKKTRRYFWKVGIAKTGAVHGGYLPECCAGRSGDAG